MKINTESFTKILGTIIDLVKYNNIKPMTNMVELYADKNICHIGATDGITKVVATVNVEGDLDNIVLCLRDLYKLIKLTTKETVELKKQNGYVEMKGNGKYKLHMQFDEMGNQVSLPLKLVEEKEPINISKDTVLALEKYHKFALCTDIEHGELCKYAKINNNTVASDSIIISVSNIELPMKEMDSFVVSQLCNLPSDSICSVNTNYFRFKSEDEGITYSGQIYMNLAKEFPVDLVQPVIEADMYDVVLKDIDTKEFISIVKRLNVFKSAFSVPSIYFENGTIYNKDKTVEEKLTVIDTDKNVCVAVAIDRLLSVLKVMGDNITIHLGEGAIKVEDSDKFYIIGSVQ